MGPLPQRRRRARDLLDRRLAAGRRLADVHGRPARPLERGPHGGGHVRADRARPLDPARSRRRSPATAPTVSCAAASASRRPPASARPGEATARREAELAAGHGEVRLAGFVTVSRPRPRRPAPGVLGGARARRAGAARAAPDCTASRPTRSRSRCRCAGGCDECGDERDAERPGPPLHHPPRAGDLPVHRRRRARRPGRVHRTRLERRRVLLTTRGSCTATALLDDPNADRARQARAGQELAGQDAAVADAAVRPPGVRARRQARVRAAVRGGRRQADLARPRRRRPAEPARLAPGGARAARAAARGHGHRARRPAHPGRGGGAARGAAHRPRERGAASRRCRRSPPRCSRRSPRWPTRLRTTTERLAADARRAALALQDLCEGPLRGMFDGPTTPGLDLDAKLLVLDLHAVRDSPAVGILMACATAWMSALLARMAERPGPRAADQRRRRVVEDRPAHGARRVVSVELQARPAVRGDEPRRPAQARRPAGGRRRRARARRGSPRA